MLVTGTEPNSGPPSRTPSILDSPTLARVERARLRLEANTNTSQLRDDSLERIFSDSKQSLLSGRVPIAQMTGPIKRGLLWQQRDRLFSRWKERYFILTRDYLHCFKRASGSANDRISDMGQFIFTVKLIDVEKVEWLNRRSYSVIGLLLGREGRVLLRCDIGLEDWFELLEECMITSKERRRALKITQGPRSRASLAAPVSHASLQAHHFGLGGTYSSALDDWLMTNNGRKLISGNMIGGSHPTTFLFSDSVPDLSTINNENNHNGISTNHSTPQKIPYGNSNLNGSRYSNGYMSQNSTFTNTTTSGSGMYGSPRRIFINSSFGSNNVVDEEDDCEDGEVQLRRPQRRHNNENASNNNGNEIDKEWLYRKPNGPIDNRHSVQTTDLDHSAHDSGVDTPPSTHRPSSYRDFHRASPRNSSETTISSSRGTLLNSPIGSLRAKNFKNQVSSMNQMNAVNGSRFSVQEQQQRILKLRNEEDRKCSYKRSISNQAELIYDPNQNRCFKLNGKDINILP